MTRFGCLTMCKREQGLSKANRAALVQAEKSAVEALQINKYLKKKL